jgi:hypothetical protein
LIIFVTDTVFCARSADEKSGGRSAVKIKGDIVFRSADFSGKFKAFLKIL